MSSSALPVMEARRYHERAAARLALSDTSVAFPSWG
jgi:hypothetical protein